MTFHHPAYDTLAAYAGGGLGAGARLVVDVHLRACRDCRAEVEVLQTLGGALLADTAPAELAPGALDRALAALDVPVMPAPRLDLEQILARGVWIPLGPNLAVKRLSRFADPGEKLVLIRAAAGQALPEHGHAGAERLVVLEGAFDDGIGRYQRGDLSERGPADRHQPVAEPGPTCLCLSATDGPLRLSGLARWLQPLVGL
jgi:putative transcriptional regulator